MHDLKFVQWRPLISMLPQTRQRHAFTFLAFQLLLAESHCLLKYALVSVGHGQFQRLHLQQRLFKASTDWQAFHELSGSRVFAKTILDIPKVFNFAAELQCASHCAAPPGDGQASED